jgi:hypothetical protein
MRFVSAWPVLGWEGEGVTNKPYLAVDEAGSVYATAPDFQWVTSFAPTGEVTALWGKYGEDLSSFNMPTGIAVDGQGQVLVLDSGNHRVLTFAPLP